MKQVTSHRLFYFVLVVFSLFSACSTSNEQAKTNPDSGRHSSDWLPAAHKEAAIANISACTPCHGSDLQGGITNIACTSCHLGSPNSVHPSDWTNIFTMHGAYVTSKGTNACSNKYCHGPVLQGVANSGPSCTSCHLGSSTSVHPDNWVPVYSSHGPYVISNGTSSCSNEYCHGTTLSGVAQSGPSCTSCHLGGNTSIHPLDWSPVYSTHGPYVSANSTSACANQYCHGLSLTGVSGSGPSCMSCHLGGITAGHPTDWVPIYSTHGLYVNANGTGSCSNQACHGTTLSGVANSGPSCTLCHLGSATSVHPTDWLPVYSSHGSYVAKNGTASCSNQYCHGSTLTGVMNSGPSCSICHMGGATSIHPTAWMGDACSNHGQFVATNGTSRCSNIFCHGANLQGVTDSGPSCTSCHSTIPTSNQCNYCHGVPPDGNAFPNNAGKHAKHLLLNGVTCATCHNRACDQHANGVVDVIFDPAYNAETGVASFGTGSGATCSNVSCHGGPRSQRIRTYPDQGIYTQVTSSSTWTSDPSTTPGWYTTSSINLSDSSQCFLCHVYGNTLYNGYYSGQHYFHVMVQGFSCISCHDTTKLSNFSFHFPDLSKHVISRATASASTNSWLNYNGFTCTSQSCHSDTRSWQ